MGKFLSVWAQRYWHNCGTKWTLQPVMGARTGTFTVKYGLWLHLTGTHTMFSNAPPGYNPWSSSRSTRALPFSCNTKTLFALFILILSWVCSEISQRLIRYITEDCRNKWESGCLLLIQTLKDFQKCKSHPLPLKNYFSLFWKIVNFHKKSYGNM